MKPFLIILCIITLVCACEKEKKDDKTEDKLKGLVYFSDDPYIENDTLKFNFLIQYGTQGEPKMIEYHIKDSNTLLYSGKANAYNNIDGMKMAFFTDDIVWSLSGKGLSGKTITVFLDPENKVTSETFTTDVYVNFYKVEKIDVP